MSYKIHFTKDLESTFPDINDQSSSFHIEPYTTNGPLNPLNKAGAGNGTLYPKATKANTTLVLYGKGMPNYGEGIQENMIHLMEHFANQFDPIYPIHGQVWYDTFDTQHQLRVLNRSKFKVAPLIVDGSNTTLVMQADPSYFAVDTSSLAPDEITDFIRRVGIHYRLQITNDDNTSKESYTITEAAQHIVTTQQIVFRVSPTPTHPNNNSIPQTRTDWRIPGWEYILQNNTPLKRDWDLGGTYTIKNITAPTDSTDVANKSYVDIEIATAIDEAVSLHSLELLDDTNIQSLTNGDILRYNGNTGMWINGNLNDVYLKLTGGNLTGDIYMGGDLTTGNGGKQVKGLAAPVAGGDAANKFWVETFVGAYVSAGNGNLSLSSLSDVRDGLGDENIIPVNDGDFLRHDGVFWTRVTKDEMAGNNNRFVFGDRDSVIDGTNTLSILATPAIAPPSLGPVYTRPLGSTGSDASNIQYVRNYFDGYDEYMQAYVANELATAGDTHVTSGSFESATNTLYLNMSNNHPQIVIPDFDISSTATANTTTIIPGDPNANLANKVTTGFATEHFATRGVNYDEPPVLLQTLLDDINAAIGNMTVPKQRIVFTSNGNSTIYLNDTSTSPGSGQMNPQGVIEYAYVAGYDSLSVYVNGIKQYASTSGFRLVSSTGVGNVFLWPSTDTGLGTGTYTFQINVNGQGYVTVSLDGALNDLSKIKGVMNAINSVADTFYFSSSTPDSRYAFGVYAQEGEFVVESALPGTGSSIDLIDGTLFAGMTSIPVSLPLSTGGSNPSNYPATTYHYNETGRIGKQSQVIEFVSGSVPPAGSVVEVIIERDMFYEQF